MKKAHLKNLGEELYCGKIACVGRNYAEHAKELGNEVPEFPIIFLKPASSIIYGGDKIIYPDYSEDLQHEVELLLLIGKDVKNASLEDAEDAIYGYGVGLDMTLRDLQREYTKKGQPWTLAKCFDGAAVISEFILKENYKLTLEENISLSINGIVKQNAKLNTMIFKPAEIVKYISNKMMLEAGDIIFTGTPAGVGKVQKGDKLYAKIENVAELEAEIA